MINFPINPSVNDQYQFQNKVWEWDGVKWKLYSVPGSGIGYQLVNGPAEFVLNANGTVTFNDGTIQTTAYTGNANGQVDLSGYQTIVGLSANVAKLTANNSSFLGGVAANQYAYANQVGGAYTLPTANTTTLGGVKVDGTTVTIANGVISSPNQDLSGYQTTAGLSSNVATLTANNTLYLGGIAANQYAYANQIVGSYTLPTANTTTLGGVKIDGTTITIANGVISSPSQDLSGYQTTAGLSANVATLTANNTLYLGGIAANQYISTTADWVFDNVGISFPNGIGYQTVPYNGDADLLGGVAADQYAYANSLTAYQTTAGLSANVAKLSANNTSFVGTVSAANVVSNSQLSSNLANYQTTAGLSANVATLTCNNTLFLGGVAANQYAYANGVATLTSNNISFVGAISAVNVSSNSAAVTYAGATPTGYPLIIAASNTQGGTGYADFLKVTNRTAGATANNKSFRLSSTGAIEIINSAYSATIFSLSDTGGLSVPGPISVSGKQAVNGPAFSAYAEATLQTIPNGSLTKVLFQTEEFDTNSNYANSRFTPTVEGYYQLNAEVRLDGASGTGEMMIMLYKNGTGYKRGTNQQGTQIAANFWAMQVSSLVYANGTTDYFEIYVQQGSGGSVSVTAVNSPSITWFNGCMLRGA